MNATQQLIYNCVRSVAVRNLNVNQFYISHGDPNGVVSVPNIAPAICCDPQAEVVYIKSDGIESNTGWVMDDLSSSGSTFATLVFSVGAALLTVTLQPPWGIYDGNQNSGHGTPLFIQDAPFTHNCIGTEDYLLGTNQADIDGYWVGGGVLTDTVIEIFRSSGKMKAFAFFAGRNSSVDLSSQMFADINQLCASEITLASPSETLSPIVVTLIS